MITINVRIHFRKEEDQQPSKVTNEEQKANVWTITVNKNKPILEQVRRRTKNNKDLHKVKKVKDRNDKI